MDEIKTTFITKKGHDLLSKVLSGEQLRFTKAVAGDGVAENLQDVEDIISPKLTGRIVSAIPKPREHYTVITVIFTNETVEHFFQFREMAVYAMDPDEGEIAFCYAKAGDRAGFIEEYNGQWYTEDIIDVQVYTANATNIIADIVRTEWALEIGYDNSKSKLTANNLQAAVDELMFKLTSTQSGVDRLYKLFKFKPLDESDYADSYFNIMPIDGGLLAMDLSAFMAIDGDLFTVSYTDNEHIDAAGFDAEYFGYESGGGSGLSIGGVGLPSDVVLDGGSF